jgi:hypothetical protein
MPSMSRTTLNFLLDAMLLLIFLAIAWVSAVLQFVFPPGTGADGWSLWGYGFNDWSNIQFNLLSLLAFAILLHLMLHWSWVCGVISSRLSRWKGHTIRLDDGAQTLWGVGILIVIFNVIALLIVASAFSVRSPVA